MGSVKGLRGMVPLWSNDSFALQRPSSSFYSFEHRLQAVVSIPLYCHSIHIYKV